MISDTDAASLESYQIGAKIRALRAQKKLGLVQLGEHTGLSSSLLSRIERGQLVPTLPTLARIATVFGVGLDHFFTDDHGRPVRAVVRQGDRLRLPDRPGEETPAYYFESLDFPVSDRKMEAFLAHFEPGGASSKPHRHDGAEIIYLISGVLAILFDDEELVLEQSDSIYFDASHEHTYRRQGRGACTAMIVVAR